jgi:NAD+ diphosphatase
MHPHLSRATPNPNTFANNPLDRASHRRLDASWIAARLRDDEARFAPLWRLQPLVMPGDNGLCVAWLRGRLLDGLMADGATVVFLGLDHDGVPHFALDVSHLPEPAQDGPLAGIGQFQDLRAIALQLDAEDAAIMAQAKALIDWHARHGFCANCGARTTLEEAGYKRQCHSCNTEHFPRTDPVVIMLAVHGDTALLGRQPTFPARMFSALAGFVEPGESIEEAVARELDEEAGVAVAAVRYHSTQPWPYPSSLMIGCIAEAASTEINIDGIEIEEAEWFDRETLRACLDGRLRRPMVPPRFAIAHQLIRAWVNEEI